MIKQTGKHMNIVNTQQLRIKRQGSINRSINQSVEKNMWKSNKMQFELIAIIFLSHTLYTYTAIDVTWLIFG